MKRAAGAALLLLALYLYRPAAAPVWCIFHRLTGLDCPLCGLTRGLCALAKGHWPEALRWHALTPLGLGMLLALFWEGPWRARLWSAGTVAFGVYGLVRVLHEVLAG